MNRQILVFVDGELFRHITYKTKRDALRHYNLFRREGLMVLTDNGCEPLKNAIYELI